MCIEMMKSLLYTSLDLKQNKILFVFLYFGNSLHRISSVAAQKSIGYMHVLYRAETLLVLFYTDSETLFHADTDAIPIHR